MSRCATNRCRGYCRCEHEYAICLTAGIRQHVPVVTPTNKGCPIELNDSELIIRCKCCPVTIATIVDPLVLSKCDDTYMDIDWTDLDNFFNDTVDWCDLKAEGCELKYQLKVNGCFYLGGILTVDWQFASRN